jgi:hypothetical protein
MVDISRTHLCTVHLSILSIPKPPLSSRAARRPLMALGFILGFGHFCVYFPLGEEKRGGMICNFADNVVPESASLIGGDEKRSLGVDSREDSRDLPFLDISLESENEDSCFDKFKGGTFATEGSSKSLDV